MTDTISSQGERDAYKHAGVIEYVVVRLAEPISWTWNRRVDNGFLVVETKDDEVIMSSALPGLWIPTRALKERGWWAIMAATARGASRIRHYDFMETIGKHDSSRS